MSDLDLILIEQRCAAAALAQTPNDPGLRQWLSDAVAEEIEISFPVTQ